MPPLGVERPETMAKHGLAKDETVGFLFGCDASIVGMREFAEIVKRATHIHLFARLDMYEREVNGRTAAVS